MQDTGKRRLAAIMAADMVGYSRLIEVDEDGILARQKALRREVIDPAVVRHHGRVVKFTGDGALVEFPSAVAAAYAALHPDRVTHLVLHGAYGQGWRARGNAEEIKRREAMQSLIEAGWGTDNAAFHQVFASLFIPGASDAQIKAWIELQRASVLPKTAATLHEANGWFNVSKLLPQIKAPTLVTHSRHDAVQPFEVGRKLASLIPGARFVALESRNHVILPQEPAWPRFIGEILEFLRQPALPPA